MTYTKENLADQHFGVLKNESEIDLLYNIGRIQDKLPGRVKCSLTFKNNLVAINNLGQIDPNIKYTIKYLKLGHVLHGHEIFVYERVNITQDEPLAINNYIIGSRLDLDTFVETKEDKPEFQSGEVSKISREVKQGKVIEKLIDTNNIYDKLYIQFIIEKEVNGVVKEIVYNQSYEQFLREEFFDIFINSDKYSKEQMEEFLNYMTIQLYFNPRKNKVDSRSKNGLDDLEIKLAVTVPTQYVIETDGYII